MSNRYVLRFFYDEEHSLAVPVKAANAEMVSQKVISSYLKKDSWISFPVRDKYNRVMGSELISVNLVKVKYFKVEIPTKLYQDKFDETDFIELTDS